MAITMITSATSGSISVHLSRLDESYPATYPYKQLSFYIDNELNDVEYVNADDVSGYGYDYTYVGLNSNTQYSIRVVVEMYVDAWGGYLEQVTLTANVTTNAGEEDPTPPDEWDYQPKETYSNISTDISTDVSISQGFLLRYEISFANSGTATFYSSNSSIAPYSALSSSIRFDNSSGTPTDILVEDWDQNNGGNFSFTYDVTAGARYYFWIGGFRISSYGDTTFHIDPPHGEGDGSWTMDVYQGGHQTITSSESFGIFARAGHVIRFEVSFAYSGTATFYSDVSDGGDPICYLSTSDEFDSSRGIPWTILASHDDIAYPSNTNFNLTYDRIVAGTTYYVWVRLNGIEDQGSITVGIDPPSAPIRLPTYTYTYTANSVTFNVQNRGNYYMRFYVRYYSGNQEEVHDSYVADGRYISSDSYTVTGLSASTHYVVNVGYADTADASGVTWIGTSDFTTQSISIVPWDWLASNGTATALQTQAAYAAITRHGATSNFSYQVWNDMCDKVMSVYSLTGGNWSERYTSYEGTKMTAANKTLTAVRFNSLKKQIDDHVPTGIGVVDSGDTVYGSYFTTLMSALNQWIDNVS